MNFLSKTIGSFAGSSIPYTFKEKLIDPTNPISGVSQVDRNSIWTVYDGTNPKDSLQVTIFEFSLKEARNKRFELLARNAFRKLKMIKFPGIISIIDFIENDVSLYIITEPVVPLALFLQTHSLHQEAIVAGINDLSRTLTFLNEDCNSLYGGFDYFRSVFVNCQGDWKLMGFELVTNLQSDPDQPIYRLSRSMPEPPDVDPESIRRDPKKYDSYKLGQFIYAVFNGGSVDTNFKLPVKLVGPSKRLMAKRINISQFGKEVEPYFQANTIVKFASQLSELKFMKSDAKLDFFKTQLPQYTQDDIYPPGFLDHKLLPELVSQYQQVSKSSASTELESVAKQETLATLLDLILKFGTKLSSEEEFRRVVKPIIFSAFAANDRAMRLVLLTHLPNYQNFLTDSDIQGKIFTPLLGGFQDTNFMIRETTLKSITIVIDKISVKQVNQELLRVLAKSQMDPKPSIRVNTIILIIKISSKIYANSKNNVLITALAKSLRDSFVPCKMTALHGFETLIDEFSLEEICSKVLGHLAISLMDRKSSKVRANAKRVFDLYLSSVETHAKELPVADGDEDEDEEEREFFKRHAPQQAEAKVDTPTAGNNNNNNNNNIGGFGWGMVSKLTSLGGAVGGGAAAGQLNSDFNRSTPDLTRVGTPTQEELPITTSADTTMASNWNEFNDAWDTGAGDEVEVELAQLPKPIVENTKKINLGRSTDTSTGRTAVAPPLRKPLKTTSLRLGQAAKTEKPKSNLKLNLNLKVEEDDDEEDGWGDGWS
ncbi:uncharacterized protein LODBEIA_P08500 [Lodderomyces beijingensis]|uniref:Protein kinase domain-containing protein n=1 Tax=Lodderomyces beijingensis TaxID=1775926 RepID=A0ABP0ZEP6_9ASCO